MKKFVVIMIIFALVLSLVSCSGGEDGENNPDRPPAFSVLQKQTALSKHSEKGESTTFSKSEFESALGEELTYITLSEIPDEEAGTLIFNGASVISGQTVPAESLEFLRFVPSQDCDFASFLFTCDAKGYYGNSLECSITYSDKANSPPVAADGRLETVEGIPCSGTLSITEPDGDGYTVNILTYPTDGYVSVSDDGALTYVPDEGFSGRDSMVYSVTDRFGQESDTAVLSITVSENESGILFSDMQDDPSHLSAHRMCSDEVMVYRYENGSYYFDPDAQVSKMELLVMLMCVSRLDTDITAVADSQVEDDTGLSSGLKGYLAAAANKGMLYLEDGRFAPRETATVSDAAYMIACALKLPDRNEGGDELLSAVSAAVKAGIIKPENGVVDPEALLTKAHTAKMLCNVYDYMKSNNMFSDD